MLQFVLGRAGSGKTRRLRELLIEGKKAGKGKVMMIAPEQYSFETEKAIFNMAGPVLGNEIEVYSFTRLCDAVFRREGDAPGKRLSDGGRRIMMASAIAACEDQLDVYAASAKRGRITDLMVTAVNEMKLCGISPQELTAVSVELGDRGLSKKLSELAMIYGAYDALVAASYLDSRDDLTRLAEQLETSAFFEGYTVYVDSFEGFTAQEYMVLRQILRRAREVVISLCTDGLPDGNMGLFALVNRTEKRLTRIAREENVPVAPPELLTAAPRFENENLKLLEAQLFCPGEILQGDRGEGIHVFLARDVYEEAEYVAATIRSLAENGACRYRDISIICRSPERYYNCLDTALAKRGIPCFVSEPARVDAEPVPRFVLGAFEIVEGGFRTDDLLGLLKTGVSGFTTEEISDLENYAFLWRIQGSQWKEEFFRHPGGFGKETTDEDLEVLRRLNALRVRLIAPLERFREKTADASGEELSQAVFHLLQEFHLEETVPAYCHSLEEAGELQLSQKQKRIWDMLMETLDQMHSILGTRKTARARYYQLLKEVIAGEDVSEIPETLDQVIFGTAEQVRQSSPKIAFLIGAAQGEFPLIPKSSGVFSDAERRELIALELPLGDPLELKTIEERYLAYSVACAPSRELYLSCPGKADGEEKEVSELISAVLEIFPELTPKKNLPDEYFSNSREAAFSRMAARFRENSPEAGAFRKLFDGEEEYAGRMEALSRAGGGRREHLESAALAGALFGAEPKLSPTQIEVYHNCKFQYFCRYGLVARERRPAEVDVMQYGTLMHYLFEKNFSEDGEIRRKRSTRELREFIEGLIRQYAEENLGGYRLLEGRQKYRLERMAHSAELLILHVEEELGQSQFQPEAFEFGLGHGGYPPLRVETGAGRSVTVGGTIDRVDVLHKPQGDFVRVVDYKTGRKEFKLCDVLHGLNMQMLIYLAALVEAGKVLPAGILYMPAAEPTVSADKGMDEAAIQKGADRQLRMSGVVLSDSEIIEAMESGAKGRFIPASLNKDGSPSKLSSVLTSGELQTVLRYSKRLIAAMAQELWSGNVEALPNLKNKSACRFCPYQAVCGKEYGEKDIVKEAPARAEVLEEMEKVLAGEEKEAWGEEDSHGSKMDR